MSVPTIKLRCIVIEFHVCLPSIRQEMNRTKCKSFCRGVKPKRNVIFVDVENDKGERYAKIVFVALTSINPVPLN